ncbi:MAG TPA: glycosyltransferase family A protein [Candidatus Bathyarchaeia archaeon]|nr:glycosyltransferase family A protein [Candidatus Bathyarchaeia archaeon]
MQKMHTYLLKARKYGLFLMLSFFSVQAITERPMVVVIPSYNNQQWCIKNLASVFSQQYTNYRVIYIDDCSTDKTASLVNTFLKSCDAQKQVTFISNSTNQGSLANLYRAIHACADDEIIVLLDGDDCFAHEQVLAIVNDAYEKTDSWIVYSQHQCYPSLLVGDSAAFSETILQHAAFRRVAWVSSALRTFYAGLFKQIPLQDLLYKGTFFPVAGDLAYMFPMLEMAGDRIFFLDEILYIYNIVNPLNDFKVHGGLQKKLDYYIRGKDSYDRRNDFHTNHPDHFVDIIIFDDNNIQALISSVAHLQGYSTVHVVSKNQQPNAVYFNDIVWHTYNDENFSSVLCTIFSHAAPYILMIDTPFSATTSIDVTPCARLLAHTHAHAFFLAHNNNMSFFAHQTAAPLHVGITETVCAWQFCYGTDFWRQPYTATVALYRAADLHAAFFPYVFTSKAAFDRICYHATCDIRAVGLYYDNTPLLLASTSSSRSPCNSTRSSWRPQKKDFSLSILHGVF